MASSPDNGDQWTVVVAAAVIIITLPSCPPPLKHMPRQVANKYMGDYYNIRSTVSGLSMQMLGWILAALIL